MSNYDTALKTDTVENIKDAIESLLASGVKASRGKVAEAVNLDPDYGDLLVGFAVASGQVPGYELRKAEGIVPVGKTGKPKTLEELKKDAEKAKRAAERTAAALAAAQAKE